MKDILVSCSVSACAACSTFPPAAKSSTAMSPPSSIRDFHRPFRKGQSSADTLSGNANSVRLFNYSYIVDTHRSFVSIVAHVYCLHNAGFNPNLSDVCFLRLDLNVFSLLGPASATEDDRGGECAEDVFTVGVGDGSDPSGVPRICGENDGQHSEIKMLTLIVFKLHIYIPIYRNVYFTSLSMKFFL